MSNQIPRKWMVGTGAFGITEMIFNRDRISALLNKMVSGNDHAA